MSWLVPLYLSGLAALALPFLFHLVRRTPRSRQEFSSLMFLSPTPPRLTRRSRIDHWLLLALRMLALALLAVAFTRPFLRESVAFSPLDLPGRRVALLIDTSASMRRGDLWQQARRVAEQQLAELNPQDDVALFGFSDRLERIVEFETESGTPLAAKSELIRQKLQTLEPGFASTDLGTALVVLAQELEAATDVQQADREPLLVVISDFQKGARIEALQGVEWPQRVSAVLKAVVPDRKTNASLHVVPDEEHPNEAEVRVRVINAADSAAEQFQIAWGADPSKTLRATEMPVYVPAGQSRVVRLPRTDEKLEADRIQLRGDDHPFDNTCYVIPLRKQQVTVLYVGSDVAADDNGLQYFLRLAVSDDPLRHVEVRHLQDQTPAQGLAEPMPRLVVVSQELSAEWQSALPKFVSAGGTVLFVPKTAAAAQGALALLPGVDIKPTASVSGDAYLLLGEIDFTHPLFAPFAGPRYGDFTKIHFWKHQPLALTAAAGTRAVARFDNGDPALLERTLDRGRVFLLASGWNSEFSQLAVSSKFVSLIANLLDVACGEVHDAVTATIHEPIDVPLSTGTDPLSVRPPAGAPVFLPEGTTRFTATDRPGIYVAKRGANEVRLAVNLPLSESQTAPMELEQLEQRGVRLVTAATRSERINRLRQERDMELERRQKVWRWLILAAVGVLLLETLLSGRAARLPALAGPNFSAGQ
ncbi:MAG: BatA domain-containing protein [Planctomycetes bacterium]|nr:BatA domain-containing protein [Planctomycetota bacterium]